ncbi:MAG: transaldolase [Nitrospirota bacterium]
MACNPLTQLAQAGQSVWLDFLSRDMIRSGELTRLVREDNLSGVTSNPTIFQGAIEGSDIYDEQIKDLAGRGVTEPKKIYETLTTDDIREAADILKEVYDKTGGQDGFVSIEVSPGLARDADGSIKEAKRLFSEIGRKNILVKIPGLPEGMRAIEDLTAEGVNVNVTLLFSVQRHEAVAQAYLKGIERRLSAGQPVSDIHSVASFFVSRVDALFDMMFNEKLPSAGTENEEMRIRNLYGKVGVANCKLAYQKYKELFLSTNFRLLREKGAPPQRLLWASTGTKNPKYSDIKYIEELIAPDTVNTIPLETMMKFKDHGKVRVVIEQDLQDARDIFEKISSIGINLEQATARLEEEGVKKFSDSYDDVLGAIARKAEGITKMAA